MKELARLSLELSSKGHDPESFVRGDPTLTTFFSLVREEGSKHHVKWAINGPPAKRHLKMAFRWRADEGPTLNAELVAL